MYQRQWLRQSKIQEYYLNPKNFTSQNDMDYQLYWAVIDGKIRSRQEGKILNSEELYKLSTTKWSESERYALPFDLEISVEDVRNLWSKSKDKKSPKDAVPDNIKLSEIFKKLLTQTEIDYLGESKKEFIRLKPRYPGSHNLDFLPIRINGTIPLSHSEDVFEHDSKEQYTAAPYNDLLLGLYNNLLIWLRENDFVMYGYNDNFQKVTLELPLIEAYLGSYEFNFLENKLPCAGIRGIEICKNANNILKGDTSVEQHVHVSKAPKPLTPSRGTASVLPENYTEEVKIPDDYKTYITNDTLKAHHLAALSCGVSPAGDISKNIIYRRDLDNSKTQIGRAFLKIRALTEDAKTIIPIKVSNDSVYGKYLHIICASESIALLEKEGIAICSDFKKYIDENNKSIPAPIIINNTHPKAKLKRPLRNNSSAHTTAYRDALIALGLDASTDEILRFIKARKDDYPCFLDINISRNVRRILPDNKEKIDNLIQIRKSIAKVKDNLESI
ncbi:MAG: hypothetical protein K0R98_684 [Rickettsiaceae bacterium]|jgi:hypothetical protein|nr:hypothetical protein [Rickettsiaceae bacterium]